jgi:predicted methyltransferase
MLAPNEPLGWLLRLPLQIVSPTAVARILMGPNRGLKWVVGAGNHSCWLGTYERVIAKSIAARVKPGMTVFDVGAHAGYYTLMLSRLVGHQGRVLPSKRIRKMQRSFAGTCTSTASKTSI